ncbi:hypothetical protein RQP46_000080 [Phenoliferia psychrophenolica]
MATFSSLPPEILAHIHKLSTEGQHANHRQRGRFAFGLVSRACFLATADVTEFYVAGEKEAKALAEKLELEKKWAARSGRTTRASRLSITRVSKIRRLSLTVTNKKSGKVFASLLHAIPGLIALELNLYGVTQWNDNAFATLAHVEAALGELALLQEFAYSAGHLDEDILLRILISHQELRVLDLSSRHYDTPDMYSPALLDRVALPHLRELRIRLPTSHRTIDFQHTLLCALASNSTAGIQVLDLSRTSFYYMDSSVIEAFIPHVTNVVHLTWTRPYETFEKHHFKTTARDALLVLLGAMKSLQSIDISMWNHSEHLNDNVPYTDSLPIDTTLLDTLATLPFLHTVQVLVNVETLTSDLIDQFISYIKSHCTLRSLFIRFKKAGAWTREQRTRLEEASDEAGVTFGYKESLKE